jgi:hypothetical protein
VSKKLGFVSGRNLQLEASKLRKVNWYWKLLGQFVNWEDETIQHPVTGLELNSLEHHLLLPEPQLAQEVQEGALLQV